MRCSSFESAKVRLRLGQMWDQNTIVFESRKDDLFIERVWSNYMGYRIIRYFNACTLPVTPVFLPLTRPGIQPHEARYIMWAIGLA